MKRKHFKIGLPLMAFLLAGAMAFTTAGGAQEEANLVTGYIFQNNRCVSTTMNCNQVGSVLCTTSAGQQVYRDKLSETICNVQLTHWPQ